MIFLKKRTIGSALIVAGTAIGAGMIALPISTGASGFYYSIILFGCCFLFMFVCLFVFLEATLYCDVPNANIITITKTQLGYRAAIIAWISFLLLLYASIAAYITAGGELITELVNTALPIHATHNIGITIFLIFFGCIVFFSAPKWLTTSIDL